MDATKADRVERVRHSFEGFNPYAKRAQQHTDDADVYALLAVAFEVSQLRYQLRRQESSQNGHQ